MKVVPPGGIAGFSQMTRASQMALGSGLKKSPAVARRKRQSGSGSRGASKRRTSGKRRGAARTTAARARRQTRSSTKTTRLKKGSPAAKAWGAKMRRLRNKK